MITIKKAEINDLGQLVILFDLYRQFYKQLSDIDAAKVFLKERLENNESNIFIAIEKNEAIGFTQLYPVFSSVSMQKAFLLNDLYVHPAGRKKGIGALLLEAAKEFGKIEGAKWLLLFTGHDNFPAQSLYQANGWQKSDDVYYQYSL